MKNSLRALVFGLLSLGFIEGAFAQTAPSAATILQFEAMRFPDSKTARTYTETETRKLKGETFDKGSVVNAAVALANYCARFSKAPTLTEEGLHCESKKFRDLQDRVVTIMGPPAPKTTAAALEEIADLASLLAE
jgi:hypothetical protein